MADPPLPTANLGLAWNRLTPDEFERVVELLVLARGFEDVQRLGGAGDQGVDIQAFHPATVSGIAARSRKWIFQCKHTNRVPLRSIADELARHASSNPLEPPLDTWVLATSHHPSPALRRWFDGVATNPRYPFHIVAWWRADLEHFLVEAVDLVAKHVPEAFLHRLRLTRPFPHRPEPQLPSITARLRQVAELQIARYASGKYIPRLYVRRGLETVTAKFFNSEAAHAATTRASMLEHVSNARKRVDIALRDRQTLRNDISRRLQRRRSAEKRKSMARVMEYLDRQESNSSRWLKELHEHLQELRAKAESLPTGHYWRIRPTYEGLVQSIASIQKHLRNAPRTVPEESVSQAVDELKIGRALFPSTDTRALQQELSTIITFAMRLWKPGLLIIDRAGSGKTNIVCHEVASRAGDVPVVLIFGRQPLVGPQSLLEEVHRSLHLASDGTSLDIDRLDRMTDEAGTYLFVVIDGINEQRDLIRLDNSIAHFLRWAADHRVRVLLTCRDIYWSFFDHGKWTGDLHDIHRDALGDFTRQEYNAALPTYLAAFNLRCTLAGQALRACQYPLLLRFFCEAYGSVDGPTRELGEINEIRLKELFDEYWSRKTDEIRRRLGHANATLIEEYLASLVSHMFTTGVTSVLSSELAGITGDSDTATGSSMYVQLLDEDIILEEHPTEDGLIRRVGFVYEAFMEYVLARTIMRRPNDFGLRSLDEAVGLLMAGVDRWVNSRGVAEFVAVMMFDYRNVKQTWAFLAQLVNGGPTWIEAFWAILTKVRVNWLDESLYDLLPRAVIGEGGEKGLLRALAGLGRLEDLTSSELGEAILWTVFMPGVLSWSDAGRLPSFTQAELTSFTNRIAETRQSGLQKSPVRFAYNIFPAARECLPPAQGKEVDKLCKRFTSPGRPTEVIRIIWRMFPERRILLLNGLFADDLDLRGICAERLQFVRTGRVAALKCMQSIVKHEKEPDIRTLIEHSIEMLRREEERTERAARPLYSAEGRPRRIDRRKPRRRR